MTCMDPGQGSRHVDDLQVTCYEDVRWMILFLNAQTAFKIFMTCGYIHDLICRFRSSQIQVKEFERAARALPIGSDPDHP